MKKIILILSLMLSSTFAQSVGYADLFGEIQVNSIIVDKCLEEVGVNRKTDGKFCTLFLDKIGKNINVYQRVLSKNFSDFNTKDTFWTEDDWTILKNQMKKMVYLNEILK